MVGMFATRSSDPICGAVSCSVVEAAQAMQAREPEVMFYHYGHTHQPGWGAVFMLLALAEQFVCLARCAQVGRGLGVVLLGMCADFDPSPRPALASVASVWWALVSLDGSTWTWSRRTNSLQWQRAWSCIASAHARADGRPA